MSLLIRIERFRKAAAMAETTFGRTVANDPRLVRDIRHGRTVGPQMIDRIERLLSTRPEGRP